METNKITLTRDENRRLLILSKIQEGIYTVREAAGLLGLSLRQSKRLLARFRQEGAAALAHGNRGRKPKHALPQPVQERVLDLAQTTYRGVNYQHLAELLAEREGLALSRASVRRVLLGAGIRSSHTRRPPKHHSRRERMPQFGMLLQIDASHHPWFEDRGPKLALIGAVDDATGQVIAAHFQAREDSAGYFRLLQDVLRHHGIPLALYSDRHSIFTHGNTHRRSLEEELAGTQDPTQFGRILRDLGIQSILARSPQAKGRVERTWETLQDRLVVELRLAGVSTLDDANRFLEGFIPRFNKRFAVAPADPGVAFRDVPADFSWDDVFSFRARRKVAADNTLSLAGRILSIPPGPSRTSYARATVEVYEHLNGAWSVFYKGLLLVRCETPQDLPTTRTKPTPEPKPKAPAKPTVHPAAHNHPWRKDIEGYLRLKEARALGGVTIAGSWLGQRLWSGGGGIRLKLGWRASGPGPGTGDGCRLQAASRSRDSDRRTTAGRRKF